MVEQIHKDLTDRMEKAIAGLKLEFGKLRTGRATPALLDAIRVDYYGTLTPLQQIASISAPEPRLIIIQPWDMGAMAAIEKSILKSELGLTPQNDGKIIRLPVPALTEDRRKDLVKLVHRFAEEGRVAVRNVRHTGMEALKKAEKEKKISEDDHKRAGVKVQALTDDYIKKIEMLVAVKSKEILEI